ncbi:MAG: 1-acyl-sn-glycerol-3-phosphate acyltransferase [Bdellovibrionaceae bacterium]|nr:1-acyl-sn-glycerol-3-phosphate acyltransferase [Bdellovibrio sp.]
MSFPQSQPKTIRFYYNQVRAAFKLIYFILIILSYLITALFFNLTTRQPIQRRYKLVQNANFYAKFMLKAFNVELICKENIPENENSLVIGNHMGFIDIVCLQALRGSVFITSLEMKHTPGLGQITDLAGCAYVNRKNRMNIHEELKGVTEVLKEGFRVVLYPESVASDGERVLPFKKTLLMSAGLAHKPIRPFVFNFRKVNGGPVYFWHRDAVCWYGNQSFFPAIWRSLQLDSVTCEVEFLPLVHPKVEDDRTKVAQHLHAIVSEKFEPFYPTMNEVPKAQESNILSHSV